MTFLLFESKIPVVDGLVDSKSNDLGVLDEIFCQVHLQANMNCQSIDFSRYKKKEIPYVLLFALIFYCLSHQQ